MDSLKQELIISGRVQGVGFRYTSKQVAQRYDVTGWVKNLTNGTVQIVVEGQQAEIDRYLDDLIATVNATGYGRVESIECESVAEATREFSSFFIR